MKKVWSILKLSAFVSVFSSLTFAGEAELQHNINIVWLAVAACLVMFMQVGFIMLETGFTRAKNSVNVASKGVLDFVVGAILYFSFGYFIMFKEGGFFLSDFVNGTSINSWGIMSWFFQVMFAAAAATIVAGAVAERIKLTGYVIASSIIIGFIYPVFGSWGWGPDGWLGNLGFYDFAGSTMIHSLGGWLALTGAIVLGARFGKFGKNGEIYAIPGHNIPLATLGTFILWFGWFGFNAGSTLTGDGSVALVLLNTTLGGAAGAASALVFSLFRTRLADLGMTLNGALAGLVGVTAGCSVLMPGYALLVGLIAGILVSIAVPLIDKMKIDDPIGAVSVHGVNGAWGTLAVGLFGNLELIGTGLSRFGQIKVQLIGMGSVFVYAIICGFALFYLIDKTIGLRVTPDEELRGLDIAEHGYSAYPEFQSHSTSDLFQ